MHIRSSWLRSIVLNSEHCIYRTVYCYEARKWRSQFENFVLFISSYPINSVYILIYSIVLIYSKERIRQQRTLLLRIFYCFNYLIGYVNFPNCYVKEESYIIRILPFQIGDRKERSKKQSYPKCVRCSLPASQGCIFLFCKNCCRYKTTHERLDCKGKALNLINYA